MHRWPRGFAHLAVVVCLSPCPLSGTGSLLAQDDQSSVRLKTQLKVREKKDVHGRINVSFTPDGKEIVTATIDWTRAVSLWDIKTGKELRKFEAQRRHMGVDSIAITPDGKTLVTGSRLDGVFLWDLGTGKQIQDIETKGFGIVVALSRDGKTLAFGGVRDTPIHLFDIERGKETRAIEIAEKDRTVMECIAFAPNEKYLVAGGSHLIWCDTTSGKIIRRVPHDFGIHSIAFSPDGKTIAAGSWDASVELYEAATGKKCLVLKGHGTKDYHGVFSVAFSSDGRLVASAGEDGTVRLWEILSGSERLRLRGHAGSAVSVGFAPEGNASSQEVWTARR